jgi:hypothetical protein
MEVLNKDGYIPLGGVSIVDSGKISTFKYFFVQAMVKYSDN